MADIVFHWLIDLHSFSKLLPITLFSYFFNIIESYIIVSQRDFGGIVYGQTEGLHLRLWLQEHMITTELSLLVSVAKAK